MSWKHLVAVACALACIERAAFADEVPEVPHRSEAAATALSIAGTLVPIAMFAGAIELDNGRHDGEVTALLASSAVLGAYGPSLGNAYAGHPLTKGLAMRLGGGMAFTVGASMAFEHLFEERDPGRDATVAVFCIGGMALYAGGALYDILTASHDARDFNEAHGPRLHVAPLVGAHTSGLAVAGTF